MGVGRVRVYGGPMRAAGGSERSEEPARRAQRAERSDDQPAQREKKEKSPRQGKARGNAWARAKMGCGRVPRWVVVTMWIHNSMDGRALLLSLLSYEEHVSRFVSLVAQSLSGCGDEEIHVLGGGAAGRSALMRLLSQSGVCVLELGEAEARFPEEGCFRRMAERIDAAPAPPVCFHARRLPFATRRRQVYFWLSQARPPAASSAFAFAREEEEDAELVSSVARLAIQ